MTARQHITFDGLGRVRRMALSQPPHFRKGQDAAPVVDAVGLAAVRALQRCDSERNSNWRSNGSRAITA